VTALDAETSKPAADGVVIDGEKFNYFTDKASDYSTVTYIPAPTGATTVIATGTVTTDTGETTQTRGYRETIPSTSALTDNLATVKYAHRTNPGRNLNASSSSYNPYPGLIYENDSSNASAAGRSLFDGTVARSSVAGFIFHVTIPATEIKQEGYDWIFDTRQKIQMTFFGANGNSRSMDQAANTSGSWYYLKDGDASWTTVGPESFYKIDAEGNATQEKDTYSLVVGDGTKEWSGYVYVPVKFQNNYGTGIDYFTEIRVGLSSYRHSTGGATSYPTAALAEGFEVSAVSLVSTFSATTTVAIGDNGRIVDLTTGELLENNYGDADEFVGNANLVTKSDDVIAFNHLSNTYSNVMHPATTPISASGKAFISVPATFDTKMVHSSHPAIKAPMLTAKNNTEEAVAFANTRFLYLNTGVVYAKDYSGVMLYIKNDTSSTKRFNFRTYAYADWDNDPETAVTYKYTYVYGKVSILVDGATAWDNSSDNAVIPANKGAWVYIPLTSFTSQPFGDYLDDPATYWKDIDICTNSTFEKGENVTFSYVMGVTKWTDMNAGVATINGAEVTQNMHSGEFVAPNDYDGNLVTNLIDLVQAKEEASETDFAAFRANYLNTYFNDAEYSVLSASFSVTPLAYNREDASTILSANPERGYRSELFCQFAETPLTIAETPNYKINVGGTNYD
ncbi:MAG: hypothetical protein J6V50_05725, partial [Clostridia bacterium]|nr:hypothetical protein [Clostridia bacterium]